MQCLQAKTPVTEEAIYDLEYANNTALISSSSEGLQRLINTVSHVYTRVGLTNININKTEVFSMCEQDDALANITINQPPAS